ncbi:MAG: hypothetical protein K2N34_03195, partial [Lachnospiraceae bacterium]|nr:hypothetical protein [Lachnospiraceae bacterium]
LLSDRSDVQVVSGTLESIENIGFFNAFLFLSQEKTVNQRTRFFEYFLSAVLLIGNRTLYFTFKGFANNLLIAEISKPLCGFN